MRVTLLGTGAAAPHPTRAQAGLLVDCGETLLLLDCGSGVVQRMAQLGEPWERITHVALTHFHADHVIDLPTLLVAWRYGQLPPRSEPGTILGPVGTRGLLETFGGVFGSSIHAPDSWPLTVTELAPDEGVELPGGVRLAARKVPHTDESVAYSIEHAGRRLVYTGDTAYDDSLGDWAEGCDLLVTECSLPAAMAVPTHLTPGEAGRLAARARPGRLVLTHFYPPVEREDVGRQVAEAGYTGALVLAVDGWSTTLEPRR